MNDQPPRPRRRFLVQSAGSLAAILLPWEGGRRVSAADRPTPNLIRDENLRAGALDWQLTRVRVGEG